MSNYYLTTYDAPLAVHVFSDRLVVVCRDGQVRTYWNYTRTERHEL